MFNRPDAGLEATKVWPLWVCYEDDCTTVLFLSGRMPLDENFRPAHLTEDIERIDSWQDFLQLEIDTFKGMKFSPGHLEEPCPFNVETFDEWVSMVAARLSPPAQ